MLHRHGILGGSSHFQSRLYPPVIGESSLLPLRTGVYHGISTSDPWVATPTSPASCPKVSCLLCTIHMPNELLPASAVSRAAIGLFTEDPLFTVLVRCACLPLAVLIHYLREAQPCCVVFQRYKKRRRRPRPLEVLKRYVYPDLSVYLLKPSML